MKKSFLRAEKNKTLKAVTLIELIMVIMVVGILTTAASMYIKETINLWSFLSFRNEVVSQGRMALSRMEREMRQIKDKSSVYIATASRFQFDDINNNNIDYQLSGNNLMRNSRVLASGVTSLSFAYYDSLSQLIVAPDVSPTQTNIRRINITLTIQAGIQAKTEVKTLRSQVYPRNF